jgi:hypothetical protein
VAGRIRTHIRGNVVGYVAVFIALSGSAYAAVTLERNQVKSKHIAPGQVKNSDLKSNSVNSPKVADGSLVEDDFAAGELPAGPRGPEGEQGPPGSPDTPQQVRDKLAQVDGDGSGIDADSVDGQGASNFAPAAVEGWHNVTYCPVQPGFPAGSNWRDFGNGTAPVSYRKDPWGVVHLRGTMTGGTNSNSPFTLPEGYQPTHDTRFAVPQTASAPWVGAIDVWDTGELVPWGLGNPAGSVSLDGVSFQAAPADGITGPCWST